MRYVLLGALLCALVASGCNVVPIHPGPGVLQAQVGQGNLVILERGDYGDQIVNGDDTIFLAKDGATLTSLNHHGDDVLYTGFDIDAQGAKKEALHLTGDHLGFHNGSAGNTQNIKGAFASGRDITFDHVRLHDVFINDGEAHAECLYAMDVPGFTVRDSLFERCETFDLFFTHRSWACDVDPCPGAYGDVTLERNRFLGGITYSVMAAHTDSGPFFGGCPGSSPGVPNGFLRDWRVVDNTFRLPTAYLLDCPARWDGFVASGNTGG